MMVAQLAKTTTATANHVLGEHPLNSETDGKNMFGAPEPGRGRKEKVTM